MNNTVISIILTVIVTAVILFFALRGWRKGFLRVLFSTFQVVIVIILSMALTTPLANYLEGTSLGEQVYSHTFNFIDTRISTFALASADGETPENPDIDGDIAAEIVDTLGMPTVIKNLLVSDDYVTQQLSAFEEYLAQNLTSLIMRALSFIILTVIILILVKVIKTLTKFINKIPIIGGINKLLGLLLGILQALIILWIISIAVMIFSGTEGGSYILTVIQGNAFLNLIYDNNLLLMLAAAVFTAG